MTEERTPDTTARACELVGRFLYHFARIELELDDAIRKLFKLDPAKALIVTANIDFFRKLSIVRAAINYQRGQGLLSLEVDSPFSEIAAINDERQIIAHCAFAPAESGGVQFKRTIAKKRLRQEDPHWTEHDFEARFVTLDRLAGELKTVIDELEPKQIDWAGVFGFGFRVVPFTQERSSVRGLLSPNRNK